MARGVGNSAQDSAMSRGQRLIVWLVALVPFTVLVAWHWSLLPLLNAGDYAQYILHAKALLAGRGYTDTGYLYTPRNPIIGPSAYPPGLPLTLVPVIWLFGVNMAALKALSAVTCAIFAVLAGLYFGRTRGVLAGAGVVMLVSTALELEYATNTVLSDAGFGALVWMTLVIADRPGTWTRSRIALLVGSVMLAISYRIVGVVLVPTLAIFALFNRRRLGLGPWIAFGVLAACCLIALALFRNDFQFVVFGLRNLQEFAVRVRGTFSVFPLALANLLLYPFGSDRANDIYHYVFMFPTAAGALTWLFASYRSMLGIFTVLYTLMLLVSPVSDGRYLWPLYPLMAFGLFEGLGLIARAFRDRLPGVRRGVPELAIVTVVVILASARGIVAPKPATLLERDDVKQIFSTLAAWNRSTPVRAVFPNPRVLTLTTGIPAMAHFDAPTDEYLAELTQNGITHVVDSAIELAPAYLEEAFRAVLREHPEAFEQLLTAGAFTVYAFHSPAVRRGP